MNAKTADDLYARLEALSKLLEGSGRIDERDHPDAYATILDAMAFVRRRIDGLVGLEYLRSRVYGYAPVVTDEPGQASD